MQVWRDNELEQQVDTAPVGAPPRAPHGALVALVGSDPLARRALAASLAAEAVTVVEVGPGEDAPIVAEVVLYDDGLGGVGALRPAPDAPQPWLALVATGARARAAMVGGFRGAIGRDATREALVTAIRGLRHGLVTIDERFARDLLPAPAAHDPLQLTPREREVLELVAEGLSNKEIATQLGVSPHTAKFHVTALLDKLGAETRTEAVVLAARAGLLAL